LKNVIRANHRISLIISSTTDTMAISVDNFVLIMFIVYILQSRSEAAWAE